MRSSTTPRSVYQPDLKADLVAGFLVFLIALPLCLGIAMASGFPPVAGILTAIVGGVIATFLGSAQLTIKGPAAGLIVIALGAVQDLGGGDLALGYRRAIATVAIAGAIQVVLALVRAGKFGAFFPPSVVHGMLAAIGVIIVSKQAHIAMGVTPEAKEPLALLAEIPHSLMTVNPAIAIIGVASLVILFGWPRLPSSRLRMIPAPLMVLGVALPLGLWFGLDHAHGYSFAGKQYQVGPEYLVQLPGSLINAIAFPDFSVILGGTSIKYIIMFTLVGSIESLLSAKAVDALDPERRQSDLDRDLLATGSGNVIAGLIGGLPMISEIVRSSANINSGARSRYANFFHGVFLLLFVALLPGLLQLIPLAALAAMLIYTGVRLASLRGFARYLRIGKQQLVLAITTLLVTLATDLLVGVAAGVALKLILHIKHGVPVRSLFKARIEQHAEGGDDRATQVLRVRDAAVFSNLLGLKARLDAMDPEVRHVIVDLSDTRLVDHPTIEALHQLAEAWRNAGRELEVRGLEQHDPVSAHELAARRKPASGMSPA